MHASVLLLLLLHGATVCSSLRVPVEAAPRQQTHGHAASRSVLTAACAASLLLGAPSFAAHVDPAVVGAYEASHPTLLHMNIDGIKPVSNPLTKLILPPANAAFTNIRIPISSSASARVFAQRQVLKQAEPVSDARGAQTKNLKADTRDFVCAKMERATGGWRSYLVLFDQMRISRCNAGTIPTMGAYSRSAVSVADL